MCDEGEVADVEHFSLHCTSMAEERKEMERLAKFTDEQYTTINQTTAGRFDPRVFVNCLQVEK